MAASTLTTAPLSLSDNGKRIRVSWTNAAGTTYTSVVVITVLPGLLSLLWQVDVSSPVYHWSN